MPNRSQLKQLAAQWLNHPFFLSAVVLGIDIGLEGIGLYLRRGAREIYARTILFDIPDPAPLAKRRAARASRHARRNKRIRMRRLKTLFQKYGLPWLDEDAMSRSNPFKCRHRAITKGLPSAEALSVCIRSCVGLRGYDYGLDREGSYPWGDSNKISDARKWVESSYITREIREEIENRMDEFEGKKLEQELDKLRLILKARYEWSQLHTIESVLAAHCQGGHDNLRQPARGYNFPRTQVWEHLKTIILHPKHRQFLPQAEEFLAELGLNPNLLPEAEAAKARRKAIFFYNRKTRFEMAQHFASKVRECPFARHLGLPHDSKCATKGDPDIRKWNLLEFLCTRRLDLTQTTGKKGAKRTQQFLYRLSSQAISVLLDILHRDILALTQPGANPRPDWAEVTAAIDADLPVIENSSVASTPQTKSKWNKDFYSQLRNLLLPTRATIAGRASLCSATARALFDLATLDNTEIDPQMFAPRMKNAGFYNWRRQASADFNPYRQVEFLLGQRIKRGPKAGQLSETAQGFLRKLFAQFKEELNGLATPDYCVIEVIGDIPRNTKQRQEMHNEQQARAEDRQKLFEKYGVDDSNVPSARRRVSLYEQQRGICPFTGLPLPASPFDSSLEIEHLFPQSLGGLGSDENLVLTWRTVNAAKGSRLPFKAARTPVRVNGESVSFLSFEQMIEVTSRMRWNARKREIFAWGTNLDLASPECHLNADGSLKVPPFGSPTRVAQLARQLRAELARWMQIDGANDADELARRIGTPSGWLTAQARRSWLEAVEYSKIRAHLVHHLIDAAILAQIPPREGMNDVSCGGIFYSKQAFVQSGGGEFVRHETWALDDFSPASRLRRWLDPAFQYDECPVFAPRSRSNMKSLGDSTFWRQPDPNQAHVAQRTALDPKKFSDGQALRAALERMQAGRNKRAESGPARPRKHLDNIPSATDLQKWLDLVNDAEKNKQPLPILRLRDGTPVKSVWKWDSKGSFTGLGWSGTRNSKGGFQNLRLLSEKFYRLEIWLGYSHAAAAKAAKQGLPKAEEHGWIFQKRLVPNRRALRHLNQLGLAYSKVAPSYLQNKPEEKKTLRELIIGDPLLPFSKKVTSLQLGQVLRIPFSPQGKVTLDKPVWIGHFAVSAIEGESRAEFKCLTLRQRPANFPVSGENVPCPKIGDAALLAALLGHPSPAKTARVLQRRIPPLPLQVKARRTASIKHTSQPDLGI